MFRLISALGIVFLVSSSVSAHFPWLAVDEDGKAVYFFGETPAERNYKLPAPIMKAQAMWLNRKGQATKLVLQKVELDDFIGMSSDQPLKQFQRLVSKVTYGMYAGSRLDYYSIYHAGPLPKDRKTTVAAVAVKDAVSNKAESEPALQIDLQAQLVDTDHGVDVFVSWKGKPLSGVDVTLFCEDGHQEGAAKTDKEGKVSFSDKEVEDGLNGIIVGHTLEKDHGELDGKQYTSSSHYLTVTFHDPQDFE